MTTQPSPAELVARAVDPARRDFGSFDEEAYLEVLAAIEPLDFRGLALVAPAGFDLTAERMPVLAFAVRTCLRDWLFPVERTVLVAVHLDTGRCHLGAPFAAPEHKIVDEPSSRGPRPQGSEARGVYTRIEPVDLRAVGGIPWAPGGWACTLCSGKWRSNTITFDVRGETTTSPGAIDPGAGQGDHGRWARHAQSPRQDGLGVSFRQGRASDDDGGSPLFGSLRVMLRPGHFATSAGGRAVTASARVPVTLLRLGSAHIEPRVVELPVPVLGDPEPTPGTEVAAHFRVDALGGAVVPEGEYWLHCVVDRYLAEPLRVG
ncbi:MAG: hypothetical protein K0V04_26110 [Deltaproteobacteria bacterium]|nr:hypothetical protein [Deltaproteobacteria bacterium]